MPELHARFVPLTRITLLNVGEETQVGQNQIELISMGSESLAGVWFNNPACGANDLIHKPGAGELLRHRVFARFTPDR